MDITMTVEDIIRQEREINKLREKLRKAEARAEQAENAVANMESYAAGIFWVVNLMTAKNGESKALPLIDFLWNSSKEDMKTNTRLRNEKAAWKKERRELLEERLQLMEEIEQLKAEAKTIAEGVVIGREETE